jgi:hypothetical protein
MRILYHRVIFLCERFLAVIFNYFSKAAWKVEIAFLCSLGDTGGFFKTCRVVYTDFRRAWKQLSHTAYSKRVWGSL